MDFGIYSCGNANVSLEGLNDQLYSAVVLGEYENAVTISLVLDKLSNGNVVKNVVDRLLRNSIRNTMEYSYKLWSCGGRHVVANHFPVEFRLILGEDVLKLVNKRDNLALKLGVDIDGDGDRGAWGDGKDKSSNRVSWKMIPIWEGNKTYFKIYNPDTNMYLKSGIVDDNIGDRRCYGSSDADTNRHQWYLHPVKYDEDVLFFIYNRKYNQALKLGRDADNIGDRVLWGHNGYVTNNPEHFAWRILP
ncbi:microvitellogenin-like [Manduca sexta]|uniref:Uncharacterized protein n=1 Tax=Manduca sexta TaxID=7130 RepID=A0A921ZJD2_MANSE|nr:microvitellogenin-like [Manduca sexta]KAG6458850.1 hypothetical protein O3G_MSEX011087 [Manduca sexta]KAG6458851.1 hypothetical protein O3G_MSEX011087 [Manduca sexta]